MPRFRPLGAGAESTCWGLDAAPRAPDVLAVLRPGCPVQVRPARPGSGPRILQAGLLGAPRAGLLVLACPPVCWVMRSWSLAWLSRPSWALGHVASAPGRAAGWLEGSGRKCGWAGQALAAGPGSQDRCRGWAGGGPLSWAPAEERAGCLGRPPHQGSWGRHGPHLSSWEPRDPASLCLSLCSEDAGPEGPPMPGAGGRSSSVPWLSWHTCLLTLGNTQTPPPPHTDSPRLWWPPSLLSSAFFFFF